MLDRGPGLTPDAQAQAGQLFYTTKDSGRGLGLFLVGAALRRFGGVLTLSNRDGGGVRALVVLPLSRLRVATSP